MKANINNSDYLDNELSLAEPHFDDEATLLMARPVVPLERVKAAQKRRGRAFGLAIATSLLVGFLGATAVYRLRSQKSPVDVINASVPGATGSTTDDPTAAPTVDADRTVVGGVGTAPAPAASPTKTAEMLKAAAGLKPNTATVKKATVRKREPASEPATDDYPESNADVRWESRREARREARRETWREARARRNSANGAARIREIFEGSPRPIRPLR